MARRTGRTGQPPAVWQRPGSVALLLAILLLVAPSLRAQTAGLSCSGCPGAALPAFVCFVSETHQQGSGCIGFNNCQQPVAGAPFVEVIDTGNGTFQARLAVDVIAYWNSVADAELPEARVGTVDKFQGQEAPVVLYSMTTSSPEEAPHGMEFLYSRHRLNVATSRALCAAVLIASSKLLDPECRTPRQMLLANGLCELVERAREVSLTA